MDLFDVYTSRKCPRCGYSSSNPQAKFCRQCGNPYPSRISKRSPHSSTIPVKPSQQTQKRCIKCGNVKHHSTARYCSRCGGLLDNTAVFQTSEEVILPEFDDIIRLAQEKKKRKKKKEEDQEFDVIEQIKKEINTLISDLPSTSSIEEELEQKIEELQSKLAEKKEIH